MGGALLRTESLHYRGDLRRRDRRRRDPRCAHTRPGVGRCHRWGTGFYGKLNGALAAPVTAVTALAPGVAALVAEALGSYAWMAVVMAVLCALGGVLAVRR
jgi:hypothetical protein